MGGSQTGLSGIVGCFGMIIVGVWPLARAHASPHWECGDSQWVTPPSLEDGIYSSTLTAECKMSGGDDQTLPTLANFIRTDIETSGKLEIHTGPTVTTVEGLPGVKYDVTDRLKSEGSPAAIRQDLIFATDR